MPKLTKQGVRDLDPPRQKNSRRRPAGQISGPLHVCPECEGRGRTFCPMCAGYGWVVFEEDKVPRD